MLVFEGQHLVSHGDGGRNKGHDGMRKDEKG